MYAHGRGLKLSRELAYSLQGCAAPVPIDGSLLMESNMPAVSGERPGVESVRGVGRNTSRGSRARLERAGPHLGSCHTSCTAVDVG